MNNGEQVFQIAGLAGRKGMVGSAITRFLESRGDRLIKVHRTIVNSRDQILVEAWLKQNRPDAVVFAAAKVGGIYANDTFPADFSYDNLAIETNIIHSAHVAGGDRLVFLGSSRIYPKFALRPIKEEAPPTGPLEPTNEWRAIAKIAGVKLCRAFPKQYGRHCISVTPRNLYAPNGNFNAGTAMRRRRGRANSTRRRLGGARRSRRGAPGRPCANSYMWMISREASPSASTITTNMNTSIAARGRRFPFAAWLNPSRDRRAFPASLCSIRPSPMARRAN